MIHRTPLTRRSLLIGAGALFASSHIPRAAARSSADPRLLVVILRGGMDGLAAVPPIGDPTYLEARARSGLTADSGTVSLDDFFALNANMPQLGQLYRKGDALVIHAAASPYRARSHFDGQDVLESGLGGIPGIASSGWLNRALQRLEPGERLRPPVGLATDAVVPLVIRGPAPVTTWQPRTFRLADPDIVASLLDLYEANDPVLAAALSRGAATDEALMEGPTDSRKAVEKMLRRSNHVAGAAAAARLMARPDGPRVAAMSLYGWDTHIEQGALDGRLADQFAVLDAAIGALRAGLAPVWRDTMALIVTEFGRTVAINGSRGTDHGTATAAFVIGGAVRGGRVLSDWPGLRARDLFEGRDLRPTTDLRAVFKGVLAEHLGLAQDALDKHVFPESAAVKALERISRSS